MAVTHMVGQTDRHDKAIRVPFLSFSYTYSSQILRILKKCYSKLLKLHTGVLLYIFFF